METKTINRGDWSGGNITYKYGPRTVKIDEYTYKIIKEPGIEMWRVIDDDGKLFCKITKHGEWFYSHGASASREAKAMDEVIVQLHCTLV